MQRLIALAISLGMRGWDLIRSHVARNVPSRDSGIVLYYHAVKAHQRHRFARQMDDLLKHASPFPAGSPESIQRQRPNVAVTFDDGFRSVVENAIPELEKRRIPFTIFVPSGCLGERPSWVRDCRHPSWDERVVSPAELRALAKRPLATLGSHSITHPNLLDVAPARVEEELAGSRAQLQATAGVAIDLFSFPHGAHNGHLVEQARRAGYRHVFTIEPTSLKCDGERFTVGRVAADPDDWPLEFRLKITGAYRWRHYLHRFRQPRVRTV
jgi:peptidoglycan/xylan/chitin deacetylase (PgdA/CDA1 family)